MDMKKTAEVVMIGSMLAISMGAPMLAHGAVVSITATTAAKTADVTTGVYVLEAFKLNISANVAMKYEDGNAQAVAVTTANTKGMHSFGGTSNGGSVKQCEPTSLATPTPGTPTIATGCP